MLLAIKVPVRLLLEVLFILLANMLRREVFPAPDGPNIAEISFDLQIPLTLSSIFFVASYLFTFTFISYDKFRNDISIYFLFYDSSGFIYIFILVL